MEVGNEMRGGVRRSRNINAKEWVPRGLAAPLSTVVMSCHVCMYAVIIEPLHPHNLPYNRKCIPCNVL